MRQPVLIDVHGAFSNPSDDELRLRHARYGQKVRDFTAGQVDSLLVLSKAIARTGQVIHERDGLSVISLGNNSSLISLGRSAARVASEISAPITWIAGSPFREAICCRIANYWLPGRIQVQAHGDFARLHPARGGVKDRFRWLVARNTLRGADSIRAVSSSQLLAIQRTYGLQPDTCFTASVPINEAFWRRDGPSNVVEGPPKVGYFGRLHEERGLEDWIKTAQNLYRKNPTIEFHIVGDGPAKNGFLEALSREIPHRQVYFHGKLMGSDLVRRVADFSISLNTCSIESFGRGILEALVVEVPVVSVSSTGSTFIRDTLSPKNLKVVDRSELSETIRVLLTDKTDRADPRFLVELQKFERTNLNRLISSWE